MTLNEFTNHILPLRDKLFRYALSLLGDRADAEDVVQEVFLKVWKNGESIQDIRNPEAWCVTLTKNMSIDKMRSMKKNHGSLELVYSVEAYQTTPDRQTELNDEMGRIEQWMLLLPEKQRQVLELRDIAGLAYDEIADQLNISMDQVKVSLHRARTFLRTKLINANNYGRSGN